MKGRIVLYRQNVSPIANWIDKALEFLLEQVLQPRLEEIRDSHGIDSLDTTAAGTAVRTADTFCYSFRSRTRGKTMNSTLASNWWLLALRGVVAILFGVLVFFWPSFAWALVVVSFAIYALMDGVFAIAAAVSGQATGSVWWAFVLEGVLGITAGVVAIFYPGVTQLVLLWLIAFWAIATGILEIMAAVRLRKEIEGEWFLAGSGFLSVILGIALLVSPVAGALAIAWLIGAYAIAFGVLLLALAFRLRTRTYLPLTAGRRYGGAI